MSSYLAYSYSINLTKEEEIEIDSQVQKQRKDFSTGFQKGMKISLSMYSVFLLINSVTPPAYAADAPPPGGPVDTNVCPVKPAPAPAPGPGPGAVGKPGSRPLSETSKGAFVGGSSAICGVALQSGDMMLGLACAFLLVIGGIVMNRPEP